MTTASQVPRLAVKVLRVQMLVTTESVETVLVAKVSADSE